MREPREIDPRRIKHRLERALDDDALDDEEARAEVARMGVDVDAVAARLVARVDAFEAAARRRRRIRAVVGGGFALGCGAAAVAAFFYARATSSEIEVADLPATPSNRSHGGPSGSSSADRPDGGAAQPPGKRRGSDGRDSPR